MVRKLMLNRLKKVNFQAVLIVSVILFFLCFVIYPFISILSASKISDWNKILLEPSLKQAMLNTVKIALGHQLVSWPISLLLAWLIARTDLHGRRWFEFGFAIGFFVPALPVTLGWILLADPHYGAINALLKGLPFINDWHFNIYSYWGIVWVHLMTSSIAVKVMLLTPIFRTMDSSLEEASRISGYGNFKTFFHITLPVMMPAIVATAMIGLIYAFQSFEIELLLGIPTNYWVFSTMIYNFIQQQPPEISSAATLSLTMVLLMLPLVILQKWFTNRGTVAVLRGKSKSNPIKLGKWRLPALLFASTVAFLTMVLPVLSIVFGSFMRVFGYFVIQDPITLDHWRKLTTDSAFLKALGNTLQISLGAAVLGVLLYSITAFLIVKTKLAGRNALDLVTWLPVMLPGIVLGLGVMWTLLGNKLLQPLYGSILTLILIGVVANLSLGVQIAKSSMGQIHNELEEAVRISGGSWFRAFRDVIFPLMFPVFISIGTLVFIVTTKDISNVVLLATHNTRPLSLLQLDFLVDGRYENAAVLGVIIVIITIGIAAFARRFTTDIFKK